MKTQRKVLPRAPTIAAHDHEQARRTLRDFARFCDAHDPDAMASRVDAAFIAATITRVGQIEMWFRRYVRALQLKRPQ